MAVCRRPPSYITLETKPSNSRHMSITAGGEVQEVLSLFAFEWVFEEVLVSGRIYSAHSASSLAPYEKQTAAMRSWLGCRHK